MTEERNITEEPTAASTPVSIIMAVHDHERELEHHLPLLMEQDYPAGFEVIVVVSKGEDNTDDLLKRFKQQYDNLRTSFVPDSSRYMSRKKLAITLGVKAARYDWIMLIEPECAPASDHWLQLMTSHCTDGTDMVMGYSNYTDEASDYKRFERALLQHALFRKAEKKAYRCEGRNLLFSKRMFMEGRGFEGNTQFIRGEYDFIVNKYAKRGNTVVEQSQEAWLIEDVPTKSKWLNHHLFHLSVRKNLRGSSQYRFVHHAKQLLLHLWYVVLLAALVFFGIRQQWITMAVAGALLLVTFIIHAIIVKKKLSLYEPDINAAKAALMDTSRAWRELYYKIKYLRADQYDFTSHKL